MHVSVDFLIEVQQGHVPGYSYMHKFGRNNSVPNGSWELVTLLSNGLPFLTSPSTVRIKASGSALDIVGGSGAHGVTVIGIDDTLAEANETIATSGASASLPTITNFWRIYRAYVTTVGTYNVSNDAAITIETSDGASDIIRIGPDKGQTQHTAYSIPSGKDGYLLSVHLTTGHTTPADFRLMTRGDLSNVTSPMSAKRLKRYWDGVLGDINYVPRGPGLKLTEGTDIWIEARGVGSTVKVAADFEILLVDDQASYIRTM
jgi:hypothetical protein